MSDKSRLRKGQAADWPSLALLEFTVALAQTMKATGLKQRDLAKRLHVSPPYISSVMSGNENLTVEQMSRLAEAAGGELHVTVAKKGLRIRWVEDVVEEMTHPAEIATLRLRAFHAHAAGLSTAMPRRLLATTLPATMEGAAMDQTILAGAQTLQSKSLLEEGTYAASETYATN